MVTAGQRVDVGGGTYRERVTITRSGTPDQPIVFSSSATHSVTGPTAGFVIDGQHDVTLERMNVTGATNVPALDIRDSSGITIQGGAFASAMSSTAPPVRLTNVTRSTLKQFAASGQGFPGALTMDAATSDVLVQRARLMGAPTVFLAGAEPSVGVRVSGPRNTLLGNLVVGFAGAGIVVEAGASDTMVVNNEVTNGGGYGIRNSGATGTAITNNTVWNNCLDGIRVDGASSGVSVQNNVLRTNGYFNQTQCGSYDPGTEIGTYDDAATDTVVDYNNTHHGNTTPAPAYTWGGVPMDLATFRAASGQAAHDRYTSSVTDTFDSANSAAPGYRSEDRTGTSRFDNLAVPNTGVGPVTYADRGATETILRPVANASLALDLGASSVTVNALGSQPGFVPITSYRFDYGDGTVVTQDSGVATHKYAKPGEYTIQVEVKGADGLTASTSQQVSVLRRTAGVGLLSLRNLRYVGHAASGPSLEANQTRLVQIDLADAGSGQLALFSRTAGRYLSAGPAGVDQLSATALTAGAGEKFTMIRNSDGTVSLRTVAGNRYVSATGSSYQLVASATALGPWEKFYRVEAADAGRWFMAHVNNRYVTAEKSGTEPLIANRTSVGTWERFDVVGLGDGQVAFFAHAGNHFVTAESSGTKPLIANRTSVGPWERFTLVRNSDGSTSIKAGVNNRYVTAESSGTQPLIANRTAVGPWEKFTLG